MQNSNNSDFGRLQLCPIWNTQAEVSSLLEYSDRYQIVSRRTAGVYQIEGLTARTTDFGSDASLRAKLTSWLIQQRESGTEIPLVTNKVIDHVNSKSLLSYSKRIENFFKCLALIEPQVGNRIVINNKFNAFLRPDANLRDAQGNQIINGLFLAAYIEAKSANASDELEKFVRHLTQSKLFSDEGDVVPIEEMGRTSFKLSPLGWSKFEQITEGNKINDNAFVAMWFDESLNDVYFSQIEKALEDCGYKSPFRIDGVEHTNKIDDEIIARLNQASLVVVDLTCRVIEHRPVNSEVEKIAEARGGVYFEAGYAMGLDIPIVWTCRKDSVGHIHFDTRQYNQIVWYEEGGEYWVGEKAKRNSLRKALVNRITAIKKNRNVNPN